MVIDSSGHRIPRLNLHPSLDFSDIPSEGITPVFNISKHGLRQMTVIGAFAEPMQAESSSDTGPLSPAISIASSAGSKTLSFYPEVSGEISRRTGLIPRVLTRTEAGKPDFSPWKSEKVSQVNIGKYIIPELCVFNRVLTPGECRRVESYLALRYGMTLNGSYLDADGNLIWDADRLNQFHHRVSGIARWDKSHMMQMKSIGEYPETSDQDAFNMINTDSIWWLASANEHLTLLTMGRENGMKAADGFRLLWGDNDGDTSFSQTDEDSPWFVMDRKWHGIGNSTLIPGDGISTGWHTFGMDVTPDEDIPGIYTFHCNSDSFGHASSQVIDTESCSIDFICPAEHPGFYVWFGKTDESIYDAYGCLIDSDGKVKLMRKSRCNTIVKGCNANGRRITLSRLGSILTLSIDGSTVWEIDVAATDGVSMGRQVIVRKALEPGALLLENVSLSGMEECGLFAELNRNILPEEFRNCEPDRLYMIIEEGGPEGINPAESQRTQCAEFYSDRGRCRFNRVTWPAPECGFTFAYFDGMIAQVTPCKATCSQSAPNSDGYIEINIITGTPEYSYTLTRAGTDEDAPTQVAEGSFDDDKHCIQSLAPGEYRLTLIQRSSEPRPYDTHVYRVMIGSDCQPELMNLAELIDSENEPRHIAHFTTPSGTDFSDGVADTKFSVDRVKGTSLSYRASLYIADDQPATLMLFDMDGRNLLSKEMERTAECLQADFTLGGQGVYIIKAITPTSEHTRKLIAN